MLRRRRKKVLLMITDAGGGHRATARSLMAAAARDGRPWDLRIVNVYKEVWGTLEHLQRYTGFGGEDVYNFILSHDLTGTARMLRKAAFALVALQARPAAELARSFFLAERPDLVVSVMPFVGDVYAEALAGTGIPFGLLVSDLVDTKPYMWFTPRLAAEAYFAAVGCAEAGGQAREAGFGPGRLVESGLVLHPKHFEASLRGLTQVEARRRLGLDPRRFMALVVTGGYGGPSILQFVRAFESAPRPWQVVACCGRNAELEAQIRLLTPSMRNKVTVLGFTLDLHLYMKAADVVVTKPGPASIFEGLALGTTLALDDSRTMPQETPNAAFVERHGLGLRVPDRSDMGAAVAGLAAHPARLKAMRRRIIAFGVRDASPAVLEAMERAME